MNPFNNKIVKENSVLSSKSLYFFNHHFKVILIFKVDNIERRARDLELVGTWTGHK